MKASVIVLSWNGMDHLNDCLDAVYRQDFSAFELIVVDNGSSDGSADFVASHYPAARLLRLERNLGFAAGNNRGLRVASGEVLVLLNQDTVVHPGWLRALVEALASDPTRGIVGGKALYPDGRIQHAGGYIDVQGNGTHYGYRQQDDGQFEELREVDYVTGATLAISRAAFDAVGELDEGFAPAYCEDADWCYRVREAGFRVCYVPQAVLIHKEASTAATADHDGMYHYHRNRLRLVLKHWPAQTLVDEFLPAERAWLEGLGEGGEQLVAAMHHVYLHHLLHLTELIPWRLRALGRGWEDVDTLTHVLLTLRTTIPLKVVWTAAVGVMDSESSADALLAEVAQMRQHQALQWQGFPLTGRAPRWLLAAWLKISKSVCGLARLLPVVRQQIEFNTRVVNLLEHALQHERNHRQRQEAVLRECLSEYAREVGELAQQVRYLRDLVQQDVPRTPSCAGGCPRQTAELDPETHEHDLEHP